MPSTASAEPARLTFTQGFVCGQLCLLLVVVLFVKYVIFENPRSARPARRHQRPRRPSAPAQRRPRPSFTDRNVTPLVSELLSKLSYDLSTHPPETADWLNVLVAQAIVAYRSLVHGELDPHSEGSSKGDKAKQMVEDALNFGRHAEPGFISVDYITVTEVDFGDRLPLCSNARVRPADETGRMRIEVDVDYSDHVTLAIETKVVINFPTSRFAVLPVSLGLTLNQLSATIMAEIPPVAIPLPVNDDSSTSSPAILLSLDPDFTLCMSTTSLLGARAKLEDIPKVEQLILGRLRGWIVDNLVWPKVRVLKLPGVGTKGAVENGENGLGEFVWVESEPVVPDDDQSIITSKLIPEADEDPSELSPTLSPSKDSLYPTTSINEFQGVNTSLPTQETRSGRYRSNSSSSRPIPSNRPSPAHHSQNDFTTPPRMNTRPDRLDTTNLSPTPKPDFIPGDLNFSETSSSPYNKPVQSSFLRHSTSMTNNPTTQLYRAAFANANSAVELQQQQQQTFSDELSRREDAERWAQAGGIRGLSLGLNHHHRMTDVSPRSYGIRERVREANRIRKQGSPTDILPSNNLLRDL